MDPERVLQHVDRDAYPWTPKTLAVDEHSHQMAYLDEGSGDPVLFVHGNPTWSFLWRHFVHDLSDDVRCIAPDHMGFGCSDKPRDPAYYTLDRHIRNLSALVRELDLKDVTLVVQDWGGPIGLGWAVRCPERVKRLVLLNTFAMRPDGFVRLPLGFRMLRSPGIGEILVMKQNQYVDKVIKIGIADKKRLTPEVENAYKAPFPFPDDLVGVLRFLRMVPRRAGEESYEELGEIEAGLKTLDVPVDAFWGRKDPAFGKRVAHRFMELLPRGDQAHIHDLPLASHFVQEDAPEDILPVLRDRLGLDGKTEA